MNGQDRQRLALLPAPRPAAQSLGVNAVGSTITWVRDGGTPEVEQTTFESSADGLVWTSLGSGSRVSSGWQLTGLTLPTSQVYFLRARGSFSGAGFYGHEGSVYESITRILPSGSGPEVIVEQPVGTGLISGVASADFGAVQMTNSSTLSFTVKNSGTGPLSDLAVTFSGTHASDYTVTAAPSASLPSQNGSTLFTVRFSPRDSGIRIATLNLWSNDSDESPFTISLTGLGTAAAPSAATLAATLIQSTSAVLNGSVSDNGANTTISFDYGLTTTYGSTVAATPATLNGGATSAVSAIISGLTPSTTYHFRVRAVNSEGTTLGDNVTFITPVFTVGELDPLFNPSASGPIYGISVQPDGKVILGGLFTTMSGTSRNYIARLNADASLESTYNPDANNWVYNTALQEDEKTVIVGSFVTVGGVARNRIARINADGSLDMSFDPNANGRTLGIALLRGGKIIINGQFTTVAGITRNRIARLNSDGTLDSGFNPDANGDVASLIQKQDGKIIIGGSFTSIGGVTRNKIACLNSDGTLDTSFNPDANGDVASLIQQPDGKIIIGGAFTAVGGIARSRIARLNTDGTLDFNFNPNASFTVFNVSLQTDGKIIIAGQFSSIGGQPTGPIAWLNADGTLDTTTLNPGANSNVLSTGIQADGKVIIGGQFTQVGGLNRVSVARLLNGPATQNLSLQSANQIQWQRGGTSPEVNEVRFDFSANGGITWSTLGGGVRVNGGWEITNLNLPASGQVRARARVIAGLHNGSSGLIESVQTYSGLPVPDIAVFKGSGTAPADELESLDEFTFADTTTFNTRTQSFTIQNRGLATLTGLAVTLPTGSGDFSFTLPGQSSLAPGATTSFTVTFMPDNGIEGFINGSINIASNDVTKNPFSIGLRGNEIFNPPTVTTKAVTQLRRTTATLNADIQANGMDASASFEWGQTVAYGNTTGALPVTSSVGTFPISEGLSSLIPGATYHYRAKAMNARGTSFGANMTFITPVDLPGDVEPGFIPNPNGQVTAVAVQPDGKILIAGAFTQVGGIARSYLARLMSDGTLDATFAPVMDNTVNSLVVQRDGKIVIGGNFSTVNAVTRSRIARLMPDGSLDSGFVADADANVYALLILPDGKIAVAGVFDVISGVSRTKLARLNADGSVDSGFNPVLNGNTVGITLQTNGKLIVTGDFTTVDGVSRQRLVRLNADGTPDSSFADPLLNGTAWCAAVQRDGKILIGGEFTSAGGSARLHIARLLANGTLDSAFDPGADDAVNVILLQADGRLVTAGQFTNIAGLARRRLARLNVDGTLDSSFIAELDARATTLAKLADGRLLAGGIFTSVIGSGTVASRVALFDEVPTTTTFRLTSPTRVEWLRGGASAEAQWVKFEVSTDAGASWAALGDGTPISGGWELNGAVMPTAGQLRASATMTDSVASVSLHELIISFSGLPVPEISVFNGAGTAAANARSDNSGIFDFGPLLLGSTVTRTFTIQNSGSGVLTGIGVSFSGAGEFTATSPGSSSIVASAFTTFSVTFAPTTAGIQTRTVLIASDDADENPFEIQITAHGQIPPAFVSQPSSVFRGLGEALNLTASTTGTHVQYEWLHHGNAVSGVTSATVASPATLGHAGKWQVRAFNGVGSVLSQIFNVGVIDLSSRSFNIDEGQTLALQVAAGAPQANYRWLRGGVAIARGINPETLLVIPRISADQAGNYSLQVSMADPQNPGFFFIRTSGAITVGVVAPVSSSNVAKLALQKPILNVFAPDPWIAGVEVNEAVTAQNSPSEFTVRGLPPGVKLNPRTGQISGRPTVILQVPKRYQLTITASNAAGICERSLKTSVIVQPLPGYTVGAYHGLIDRDENVNAGHGGRFTLNVSSLGAISGHLSLGAAVHRFATVIDPAKVGEDVTASVTIPRSRPQAALSLALKFHRHTGELSALLSGVEICAWRQSLDPGPLAQNYAFNFQPSGDSKGNFLYPQAASNLKLNISSSARATWAGRFADGSTMTGSSALTLPDCIMLSTYSTIRKSSLQGKFQFYRDGTASAAQFDWLSRSPTSGFPLHPLDVTTGK
ncbi:MAG: choice-of-anchor D domain-containing protein [Verrucomicrobia bacterium]|nr:choice-of-anchor D domain-containing protein [Verrucomicrobiota bacterium]